MMGNQQYGKVIAGKAQSTKFCGCRVTVAAGHDPINSLDLVRLSVAHDKTRDWSITLVRGPDEGIRHLLQSLRPVLKKRCS